MGRVKAARPASQLGSARGGPGAAPMRRLVPGRGRRFGAFAILARLRSAERLPALGSRSSSPTAPGEHPPDERFGSFRHCEERQLEPEMTALDDTLQQRVETLVDASQQPLRWTSSTTVVIAQLVERIEALEAGLREIADAVSAAGETATVSVAVEQHSGDRPSESISSLRHR